MDKAGKWIRNFLVGKREDRDKKRYPSVLAEARPLGTPLAVSQAASPTVKRRWSFKRSTSKHAITHRTTKSFDFIPMTKQVLLDYEMHQNLGMPLALNAHAAATKIQAVYRSYLARRALRALRGLVKLQALARGYLVRKQMTAILRSMHVVMAIQVRARIQRAQMAEEPPVMVSGQFCREHDYQLGKETSNKACGDVDIHLYQTRGGLRSRSGRVYHTPAERGEYGSIRCNSVRLSVPQRDYQLKMSPSTSTLSYTDSCSTTYDGQLEEFSLKMAQRYSRCYSPWLAHSHNSLEPLTKGSDEISSKSHLVPSYMTNTKSSRAKARSHSEPKERPKVGGKQKSRRSTSMDGKNDMENQYPWLIKLHRSDNFTKNIDCDSINRTPADKSNHTKSLIPYEPPVSLY